MFGVGEVIILVPLINTFSTLSHYQTSVCSDTLKHRLQSVIIQVKILGWKGKRDVTSFVF